MGCNLGAADATWRPRSRSVGRRGSRAGLIGNFGSDVLLGGERDDLFLGDNPQGPPDPSHDVCNGQQGSDFAVEGTCEQENQMEATGPFPEEG